MKTDRFKDFFEKLWEYLKKAKVELIIIVAAIALDLITKTLVQTFMYEGQIVTVIPKFLNWHYTLNTRAGFGSAFGLEKFLSDRGIMIFFIVLTFVALVLFFFLLYKFRGKKFLIRLALAFIIGGAIGNLVDRITFGYVRDFVEIVYFGLDLGFLGTSFAIFNIADAFLTVGVVLFAVYLVFYSEEKEKQIKKSVRDMTTAELNGIETDKEETLSRGEEENEKSDNSGNQ